MRQATGNLLQSLLDSSPPSRKSFVSSSWPYSTDLGRDFQLSASRLRGHLEKARAVFDAYPALKLHLPSSMDGIIMASAPERNFFSRIREAPRRCAAFRDFRHLTAHIQAGTMASWPMLFFRRETPGHAGSHADRHRFRRMPLTGQAPLALRPEDIREPGRPPAFPRTRGREGESCDPSKS